ncbi:MAG: prenyltransferase [Planctomycetota bacterium]
MSFLRLLLGPMRLPFVILAPVCALLGVASAVHEAGSVAVPDALLVVLGAVAAHISVNAFNEYFDFKSGLDVRTVKTPFSGGSGVLPENPRWAPVALGTAIVAFVITALVGMWVIRVRGWGILPVGIAGLLVVATYTPWAVKRPLFCLIAPGLGFGACMVIGAHVALTGRYSASAVAASFIPFFLVNDLLLLNQFPDVEADRTVGRRNFPIVMGRRRSSLIYSVFLAGAYLAIVLGVAAGALPRLCLLGLVTVVLAVPAAIAARRHADDIPHLAPALGMNVFLNLVTPALVAVGLVWG